jgi:hypothetical protein
LPRRLHLPRRINKVLLQQLLPIDQLHLFVRELAAKVYRRALGTAATARIG